MNKKQKSINWIPLFSTNFWGVLNDNFLKNLICFVSILWVAESHKSIVISIATGMLVFPYIVFSPIASRLSQTKSKIKITRIFKFAEIPIMSLAVFGFYFENLSLVLTALFFMGLQSTIMSPAKYGLIREIGGQDKISYGTGIIEMLIFLGVLLGTVVAGIISEFENKNLIIAIIAISIAIIGYISSLFLKANESAPLEKTDESLLFWNFLKNTYKKAKSYKGLNYVILCLALFWLIGSLIQMTIIEHGPKYLKYNNTETSYLMALVAVSIAIGCVIAGIASKKSIPILLVPIGIIGMFLCSLIICVFKPLGAGFIITIMLLAFFAGLFQTPLNAWIQFNVKGRIVGEFISYSNNVTFLFILISAGIYAALRTLFKDTHAVFVFITLLSFFTVFIIFLFIPKTYYRIKLIIYIFILNKKNYKNKYLILKSK